MGDEITQPQKDHAQNYYEVNREKILQNRKERYHANHPHYRAMQQNSDNRRRDQIRKRSKSNYWNNREILMEKNRKYRKYREQRYHDKHNPLIASFLKAEVNWSQCIE